MYVVIAGAGLVGRGLAERLIESRHDVVVVDQNKDVCEWLASHLGALTILGSGTDVEILEQAGMAGAHVAVATMGTDADNLAFSLLAKSYDVPRVIARMRNRRYEAAYKKAGVSTTFHVAEVFANQLVLEIEEPHLRQVASFGAGNVSIVVDTVPDRALVCGKTVEQIAAEAGFPTECVITGIFRPQTQQFIVPRGSAEIRGGDRVFLVAEYANLRKASKALHKARAKSEK